MMRPDPAAAQALVAALYRGILEREPDPGGLQTYADQLAAGTDLAKVIRTLLASEEYRARHGFLDRAAVPDFAPPADPDPAVAVSERDLARLWAQVGIGWARLGEVDPDWPDGADAVAAGQARLARVEAWLAQAGRHLSPDQVVADYGIGAGGLAAALARRGVELRGFDLSPPHLHKAASRLREAAGRASLHLVRVPGDLSALAGIDGFIALRVLEYNPPPVAAHILAQAFHHLRPGGFALFQLVTAARGEPFQPGAYLASPPAPRGLHVLSIPTVLDLAARHGMRLLRLQDRIVADGPPSCVTSFLLEKEADPAGLPLRALSADVGA